MNDGLYAQMLNTIQEGIYFVDNDRKITFWNHGAELITGFKRDEVINSHCYDNLLNHVDEQGNRLCLLGCPLHETIQDGRDRETLVYLHHKKGHRIPVKVKTIAMYNDQGLRIGAAEIFVDESHVFGKDLTAEELRAIAFTDALTGIPNRRATEAAIHQLHQFFLMQNTPYTLAVVDIDHFKHVNDTWGHAIGDEILKMIAKTLAHATRSVDFVGRWGGEEFVMVFQGLVSPNLEVVLEKIRMLVSQSVYRQDESTGDKLEISVTVSIGAHTILSGDTEGTVFEKADQNLYQAKASGRNRVVCVTLEA